jgi:hypothetical protein
MIFINKNQIEKINAIKRGIDSYISSENWLSKAGGTISGGLTVLGHISPDSLSLKGGMEVSENGLCVNSSGHTGLYILSQEGQNASIVLDIESGSGAIRLSGTGGAARASITDDSTSFIFESGAPFSVDGREIISTTGDAFKINSPVEFLSVRKRDVAKSVTAEGYSIIIDSVPLSEVYGGSYVICCYNSRLFRKEKIVWSFDASGGMKFETVEKSYPFAEADTFEFSMGGSSQIADLLLKRPFESCELEVFAVSTEYLK